MRREYDRPDPVGIMLILSGLSIYWGIFGYLVGRFFN